MSQQNFLLYPAEERVDDVLYSYEKEIVHIDHDVDLICKHCFLLYISQVQVDCVCVLCGLASCHCFGDDRRP